MSRFWSRGVEPFLIRVIVVYIRPVSPIGAAIEDTLKTGTKTAYDSR